jgi:hypothetical protein
LIHSIANGAKDVGAVLEKAGKAFHAIEAKL